MTRRAVLGTEVSIVWDAVRFESFSRMVVRLSEGSRFTSGPRLVFRVNQIFGLGTKSKECTVN